jgi:hypothetical protein
MPAADKFQPTPWCTICIVITAILCHTGVLIGNLATAESFGALGESSSGWSDVGLSMGRSLKSDLDSKLSTAIEGLTTTLEKVTDLDEELNMVMSLIGNATDEATSTLQIAKESPRHLASLLRIIRSSQFGQQASNTTQCHNCGSSFWGPHVRGKLYNAIDIDGASSEPEPALEDEIVIMQQSAEVEISPHAVSLLQGNFHMMKTKSSSSSGHSRKAPPAYGDVSTHGDAIEALRAAVHNFIETKMEAIKGLVNEFLQKLKPVLLQVGKWLSTMGDKMQRVIEEFGTIIDKVQKLLDEIMKKVASGSNPASKKELDFNVFAIFDQSKDGNIYLEDLQDVSSLYGVTALQGDKAKELLKKYDRSHTNSLQSDEFALMLADKTVPSAASVVLRTYAKKLSSVSGNLISAKTRSEVATTLVNYLTLVAAKNRTKMSWISQTLTNKTLPLNFTADVLIELAALVDDKRRVTILDVGKLLVAEMTKLGRDQTAEAYKLVCDPEWWTSAGHSAAEQPRKVELISKWAHEAGLEKAAFLETEMEPAHVVVAKRSREYWNRRNLERAAKHEALFFSETSSSLFSEVLGVVAAVGSEPDEHLAAAMKSSVPAKPETLLFAKWLSSNTSQVSDQFEHLCFDTSKSSTSTMDSFANMIQTTLKKIQEFLNLMQKYSTPAGINELEAKLKGFEDKALAELLVKVDEKIDASMDELEAEADKLASEVGSSASEVGSSIDSDWAWNGDVGVEFNQVGSANSVSAGNDTIADVLKIISNATPATAKKSGAASTVFKELVSLTTNLKQVFPTVIENMKVARTEISAVSKMMDSVFDVFKQKGSPIFQQVKTLYKLLWTVYYIVFVTLTIGILFYGLWASGCFTRCCGGPPSNVSDEDHYVAPATVKERICCCFRACTACMSGCCQSHACFWSCIIFAEVVILLMFIIGIVLTLLAGVKAFMSVGCSQVYLLNDAQVCGGVLDMVKNWLETFWSTEAAIPKSTCQEYKLTTCQEISDKMMQSFMLTTGGSMMAALVTAQMIFESAKLHEAQAWHALLAENKPELFVEADAS